jgi:hypothetical protein
LDSSYQRANYADSRQKEEKGIKASFSASLSP